MLWASEQEAWEQWARATRPSDTFDVYFHPGGCENCGDEPCYLLCPNHPGHYSKEQEYEDSRAHDALTNDEHFRLAVAQYERVHGEPYVS